MRSGADYIESLKKTKPVVYHLGKRVDNVLEHPLLRWPIKAIARTYDLALDPRYSGILTTTSPLTGEKIERWNHVFGSTDDLVARQKQMRFLQHRLGSCALRCTGLGAINGLYSTTYDMDQKLGTDYHKRFLEFLKRVQKDDSFVSGAMMDVKGNRRLRPSQQADPDMYLRIIEERKDGIVVRGAKAHQTGPMIANEVAVMPCDVMRNEKDRDYAVSFAIAPDAKGITYILQHNLADALTLTCEGMDLGNIRYGCQFGATSLMIFDDVFVPKEQVFMQGEWEFTRQLVSRVGTMARMWQCGCRPAIFDLLTGATRLIAEYNGVADSSHIRSKLTEMSYLTETVWGLAIGSAVLGEATPSGAYLPDQLLTNVAKLQSTRAYYELVKLAIDITGGLVVSIPSEKDYRNPDVSQYIDKYLRGVAEVPTEHRMRVVRFIQALTGGPVAAALHHSGGPIENQKIVIYRGTDFEEKKRLVKFLAGIEEE